MHRLPILRGMAPHEKQSGPGWGPLTALMVVAALGLICLCLSVYEGVAGIDAIARASEEQLVRSGWDARQAEIGAAIAAEIDWDEAIAHLDNTFDATWARADVGVFLTQSVGFQQVAILDHSGKTVFAMDSGENVDPGRLAPMLAAAQPLIAQVRTMEVARGPLTARPGVSTLLSKPIQASAVSLIDGWPVLLYATLVQPDFGSVKQLHATAPVVVSAEPIGRAEVAQMAERYRLLDARLAPASAPLTHNEASVIIPDTAGRDMISIRWKPQRPGTDFFRRTGLVGGVVLIVFVAILLVFFRATRRAYAELVDGRAQLRKALDASQDASLAKSEFLASMSHEIRTPLNGVMGALHLLKSEALSAEGRTLLQAAQASGEMVAALINDVLDFSKIEAGRMVLSPAPTDVEAVIRDVVAQFAPACQAKGLTLSLDLTGGLGWAHIDGLRLRQCLYNLVGNAVKFTAEGSIRVTARLDEQPDRRMLHVAVADTGIGIDPASMETVFERFRQADGSTTRRFGGSGLGLAITRQLATLMDGHVGVVSQVGRGSTFTLDVMAPPSVSSAAEPPSSALDVGAAPLEDVCILVVDDNATNRMIAGKILEQLGAVVTTAESGAEAIALARINAFDLILMDIQMPDMDGVETTRRLRRDRVVSAQTPILALTANVFDEQRRTYMAAGMDGVVAKPISPADLLAEIGRAVDAAETREQVSA